CHALPPNYFAYGSGQCVNDAPLHAGLRDHKFTGIPGFFTWITLESDRHRLNRVPSKLPSEMLAPTHIESAVGWLQWCKRNPTVGQQRHPRTIGPEFGPTTATEGKNHGRGLNGAASLWRAKTKSSLLIPTDPSMTHIESHAGLTQPAEPRA